MNSKIETVYVSKEKCCGCGACSIVCPKNAIVMQEDEYGFRLPEIDHSICVNCGLCAKTCVYKLEQQGEECIEAYAATNLEKEVLNSASGGVFAGLAKSFLDSHGFVCGVKLDKQGDYRVSHVVIDKQEDLIDLQGSKYTQSTMDSAARDVMDLLNMGKQVLFSGTPCQVAAIKKLTGNPENLFTIDLICHGVPSEKMFREFLNIQGKMFHQKFVDMKFRDKRRKNPFCASLITKKNKVLSISSEYLSYYSLFLKGKIYRENCYSCPYASKRRMGDLTIGDYWGVEKGHAGDIASGTMDLKRTWSCVLVNSQKGKQLVKQHGKDIQWVPSTFEKIAEQNKQLNHPTPKCDDYEKLMQLYKQKGYAAIERQYQNERGGKLRYRYRILKYLMRREL